MGSRGFSDSVLSSKREDGILPINYTRRDDTFYYFTSGVDLRLTDGYAGSALKHHLGGEIFVPKFLHTGFDIAKAQ